MSRSRLSNALKTSLLRPSRKRSFEKEGNVAYRKISGYMGVHVYYMEQLIARTFPFTIALTSD